MGQVGNKPCFSVLLFGFDSVAKAQRRYKNVCIIQTFFIQPITGELANLITRLLLSSSFLNIQQLFNRLLRPTQ